MNHTHFEMMKFIGDRVCRYGPSPQSKTGVRLIRNSIGIQVYRSTIMTLNTLIRHGLVKHRQHRSVSLSAKGLNLLQHVEGDDRLQLSPVGKVLLRLL